MKIRNYCLPALALLLAVGAKAQQSEAVELDLPKAIEIALSDNPTIKVANLEIQRQDYVRKETVGNLLPSLSATAGYSHPIIKNKMMGDISFEADNTFSAGAALNVPLFVPGVYSTLKLNAEQMRAAVESARASRIVMVNDVTKAFYNILLGEQSLGVLMISEGNIKATVDETRTKFNNGLAAEYDLITAQVQLSNIKPTIIQTQNSIKVGKRLLKMYLSLPDSIDITLKGSLDDFKAMILAGSDAFDTNISQNTDLKSIEIQKNILNRQLKLSKTSRIPTLAFYSNFNLLGDDFDIAGMNSMFAKPGDPVPGPSAYKYRWQKPLTVGFQLSVPIFSGLKNVNKDRQIKNSISQVQLQQEYLTQSLDVEVRNAITNIITAREQMYANEKTIGQAQKSYNIANARYGVGAGTILEVNTAELLLTQAKLNYSQAIFDYLSSQADYEKIIGKE